MLFTIPYKSERETVILHGQNYNEIYPFLALQMFLLIKITLKQMKTNTPLVKSGLYVLLKGNCKTTITIYPQFFFVSDTWLYATLVLTFKSFIQNIQNLISSLELIVSRNIVGFRKILERNLIGIQQFSCFPFQLLIGNL